MGEFFKLFFMIILIILIIVIPIYFIAIDIEEKKKKEEEEKKHISFIKENSRIVWDYIVAHNGEDLTVCHIADATGLSTMRVNGIVTKFQKDGLIIRETVIKPYGTIRYIRYLGYPYPY